MTDPPAAADVVVDAVGRPCPIPVIELGKAVDGVEVGTVVEVRSDDPASRVDVPVWCRMRRQRLLSQSEEEGVFTFRVERVR